MSEHRTGVSGAGPALFGLVRFWSRRWVTGAIDNLPQERARVQDVLVLESIDAVSSRGDVSVSDVAQELGIDHSGASRMVAEAAAHGLIVRSVSAGDARRTALTFTEDGIDLLTNAHGWQEEAFERLVCGWPVEDATRFAGYLRQLAGEVRGLPANVTRN
ncbi:MAG: MarR family winged helix-turn-helix transcriptional regulator [Thermomicrobiales bacterium]